MVSLIFSIFLGQKSGRRRFGTRCVYPGRTMNWLIMGQNYHLVHHLWPSIPWFEYKPAYEATKPLLDAKESPQRLGIFETRSDVVNFFYDILIGVRRYKNGFAARVLLHPITTKLFAQFWQNSGRIFNFCVESAKKNADRCRLKICHSEAILDLIFWGPNRPFPTVLQNISYKISDTVRYDYLYQANLGATLARRAGLGLAFFAIFQKFYKF